MLEGLIFIVGDSGGFSGIEEADSKILMKEVDYSREKPRINGGLKGL